MLEHGTRTIKRERSIPTTVKHQTNQAKSPPLHLHHRKPSYAYNPSQVAVQEPQDSLIRSRRIVMEIDVTASVGMQMRHEDLGVAVVGAAGFFEDAGAVAVADDVVG